MVFTVVTACGNLRALIIRPLFAVTIVLATSACAPIQAPTGSATPVGAARGPVISPQQTEVAAPPKTAPKKIAPARQTVSPAQRAVTSLLQEGWAYYRAENYERSIAIAERAQRLDAQRAEVYLLLARGYFTLGQSALAEQLSQRGLSFSQSDAPIRRKLQSLLAEIGR